MNLQDLASIAEIVGGFAVLATLIYLVMELHRTHGFGDDRGRRHALGVAHRSHHHQKTGY